MIICKKGNITIRYLEKKDAEFLLKWLTDPNILEYYEGRDCCHNHYSIQEKFYNSNTNKKRCIVEYCGTVIGYLQFYPIDESSCLEYGYRSSDNKIYGTDQFIGETEFWNKGIGTDLIRLIVEYLIIEVGAERIVLDPQCKNLRAISCYEKCGFKKIKLLPNNELHEGKLEDCWLMEFNSSK